MAAAATSERSNPAEQNRPAAQNKKASGPAPARRPPRPWPPWVQPFLLWSERIVAIVATLAAVYVHIVALRETGGLWRDEVSSVDVINEATSFMKTWELNYWDSFPILWATLLRLWMVYGPGQSDLALRSLGFLIGIGIAGMVWWNAWKMTGRVPLLSLPLFVMAPALIRFGDGVRGYGLGILALLTLPTATWSLLKAPNRKHSILFILAALFAVQTSFSNCCLLLAIGVGGGIVCLKDRNWKALLLIAVGGILSVVSMLPYLQTMASHKKWNAMVQIDVGMNLFTDKLLETINRGGDWSMYLWKASLVVCVGGCLLKLLLTRPPAEAVIRSLILFCTASLVLAFCCLMAYFHFLKVETHPWYYIPLLGLAAVLVDVGIEGMIANRPLMRLVRLICVVLVAGSLMKPGLALARTRLTNVDLVAARLQKDAAKGDVILMHLWQAQNVFGRYYQGDAEWMTIPAMKKGRFQPYQEFKVRMAETDPMAPLRKEMEAALRSGHHVWYVSEEQVWSFGDFSTRKYVLPPPVMPPAPHPVFGWQHPPYDHQWRLEVLHFLETHARDSAVLTWRDHAVLPYEKVLVHRYTGWRGSP